ncbi:hypothetical protein GCM10020254_45530 [Streptomyces goshikiensis]
MTQSSAARAGRFHTGRLSKGLPQALDAWRVTTDDAEVAARVAGFLGGEPQPNDGTGAAGLAYEGRGQPCGCPPLLEDRKLAARDGRGPMPSVDITFQIAAAPELGLFHFMTASWQMAAQLSDLTDALERVNGPAVCDLTIELVVYTTKAGRSVCYRKPAVTVLGSPDTVAPEPPPTAEPTPAPAPSAPRRKARPAPGPTTPSTPKSSHSVSVDATLLRRAAQVLGTGDHQETVIAALSEIVAGRQQTTELARLREHVGRIAAIAGQALQGRDSSLT